MAGVLHILKYELTNKLVNFKFTDMKTLNKNISAHTTTFNKLFNSNNQILNYNTNLGEVSTNSLPPQIESFLRNNYSNYDIEQVFVHKEGNQILTYEIGIDSVYEYTIHFSAQGEFSHIEVIED